MTAVFYNENDQATAAWLSNLVEAGRLPSGFVDRRSIVEITAEEVDQYTQAHFFSGIGGWPLALEIAGVDPTLNVWTGSCPCQPFSAAGLQKGEDDDRHLWPIMRGLIEESKPQFFFGEQVASPAGRDWLAVVRSDLEALGYAVGAADLCAAGVGSPHIRQRLYFGAVRRLADRSIKGLERHSRHGSQHDQPGWFKSNQARPTASTGCDRGMGDSSGQRHELDSLLQSRRQDEVGLETSGNAPGVRLGDSDHSTSGRNTGRLHSSEGEGPQQGPQTRTNPDRREPTGIMHLEQPFDGVYTFRATGGDVDWLLCRDPSGIPRWRPVRPGTQPMAYGIPDRVVKLRGYGNAIVPQLAAEFISAFIEALND